MVAIPSGVKPIFPALLISTSSPFPPRAFSTSTTACLMLVSLVASSWIKATRPSDFCTRSLSAGDSFREVAKTMLTSGDETSWNVNSRPKPREHPVIRYEAIGSRRNDRMSSHNYKLSEMDDVTFCLSRASIHTRSLMLGELSPRGIKPAPPRELSGLKSWLTI